MKKKVAAVRQWVGRAKKIYDQLCAYEQALEGLANVCGTEPILKKIYELRLLELNCKMELYEVLSKAKLTPRQFSILNLHYLQYESWTAISKASHQQEVCAEIHIEALESLAAQLDDKFGLNQMTA